MQKWMVTLTFKPDPQMMSLLGAERAHVAELKQQGTLEAIYIAHDNSHVWMVLDGESEEAINTLLEGFPMHAYFTAQTTALNS